MDQDLFILVLKQVYLGWDIDFFVSGLGHLLDEEFALQVEDAFWDVQGFETHE
jgi:hypothetical protein